jgi:hypothetical protein
MNNEKLDLLLNKVVEYNHPDEIVLWVFARRTFKANLHKLAVRL